MDKDKAREHVIHPTLQYSLNPSTGILKLSEKVDISTIFVSELQWL